MDLFSQDWSSPAIDPMRSVANANATEWHSQQLRALRNSVTPSSHPCLFTSAEVARSRLRAVIRSDRDALPVQRWVATNRYTAKPLPVRFVPGLVFIFDSPMPSNFKRHYRWERR